MTSEVTFEIVEHIGKIAPTHGNGWTKELNRVSWNGGEVKFDIREWDAEHTRMSRGLTLSDSEMNTLLDLMADRR